MSLYVVQWKRQRNFWQVKLVIVKLYPSCIEEPRFIIFARTGINGCRLKKGDEGRWRRSQTICGCIWSHICYISPSKPPMRDSHIAQSIIRAAALGDQVIHLCKLVKLCQMLLWWTKGYHCILSAITWVFITLLASFPIELAYLSKLFIFEISCSACSAGHFKNKLHTLISQHYGKWCRRSDNKLSWHLVYWTQYHFSDSKSNNDKMRSIFHPPG